MTMSSRLNVTSGKAPAARVETRRGAGVALQRWAVGHHHHSASGARVANRPAVAAVLGERCANPSRRIFTRTAPA